MSAQATDLEAALAEVDWYHTLELAPGVVTPGWYDLRELIRQVPFPASLEGLRCLDIGTFDGFWAFEMERRGAREVRAIDILDPERWDWPAGSTATVSDALNRRKAAGRGFELARDAFGSRVERTQRSIYELDPDEDGLFDFVYVGSLLLHLRDPVGALACAARVCRGRLLVVDAIDPFLTRTVRRPAADLDAVGRPWWFKPNLQGLVRIAEAAGLRLLEPPRPVRMPPGAGHARPRLSPRLLFFRDGREILRASRRGDPHAALLLEPAPPPA
jgi:tRNA (mo5U34)-methyltransferase